MDATTMAALVVAIFFIMTLMKGIRIVPQGSKWIVQRLGRYFKTLAPGLNFTIPWVDQIAYKVTTRDIVMDIPPQDVITLDNAVIIVNAVSYINITNPEKAVYGVEDYRVAIQNLVQTTLRSIIGEMTLDDALSSRDKIKSFLKNAVADDISDWGITLKTVEIQDINPSQTMQEAMEEQAAAERARRATVTRAEGEKEAAILEADGRLEASRRDAEARIVLADANKEAIERVAVAAKNGGDTAVGFVLGEKYVDSLRKASESPNSKMLVYPADIQKAIAGLLGK